MPFSKKQMGYLFATRAKRNSGLQQQPKPLVAGPQFGVKPAMPANPLTDFLDGRKKKVTI